MLYSIHLMTLCPTFSLTMLIIWAAILLYDYCLIFVAEVERYWGVHQLSWGLGLFYLNHYLVLFSYILMMLEPF